MPERGQAISAATGAVDPSVVVGSKGGRRGLTPALLLIVGLAFPAALVGSQPASAESCGMTNVRVGGAATRHTYYFDYLCTRDDGTVYTNAVIAAAYDLASGRADEKITYGDGSIKSSRTCSDDPWIYVGSPPQCGGLKAQVEGNAQWCTFNDWTVDDPGHCYAQYGEVLPASVPGPAQRHLLFAQLQNALAMTPPAEAPPPPDPLADHVQDSAQGDGAGDTAIPHADLAVIGVDGPKELLSGLSGTFVVTVKNAGNVVTPLEVGIVFAGKLEQAGQIIAGAGLACDVVTDTGINAAVRCLGGQLPAGATTTVTVQGRGQRTAGTGMLVAVLNASRSLTETNYDNNLKQFDVAVNAGPTPATPQPPAQQMPPMQVGMCGPPGGTAVVTIADPSLGTLNVRVAPGGAVLGTIPRGTEVSIIGPCGPEGSAGLAAPGQVTTGSGWCQIDRPVMGCVSARFLQFGGLGGAAGLAKPAPPLPTPGPAPLPTEAESSGPAVTAVVTQAANVRSAPKNANNIIGKLPAGTEVTIIGCQASWCQLAVAGGVAAWVHQSLLAMRGTDGGVPQPPTPTTPLPQGPVVSGGCGRPPGFATIVIPEPNLDKVNVRESPGGNVITAIPEGNQVSIVGECGPENAAGIVAPLGQGGTAGWCQINAPVTGCVSAKYLVPQAAGGAGAAGVAKSPAPAPTSASFVGSWNTVADGVPHSIAFNQNGNSVTGSYAAADGSNGTIAGNTSGRELRFSWSQSDGVTGSGKFTLSEDGQSFAGSYNFGQNPDAVEGSWSGSRR